MPSINLEELRKMFPRDHQAAHDVWKGLGELEAMPALSAETRERIRALRRLIEDHYSLAALLPIS